ncbi:MAG: hypothetical protein NTY12_00285 [Candidatus Falkowbacteria bacterium]|nr:hypothetical protein [Candidatus Falkowbacteria bacterium]
MNEKNLDIMTNSSGEESMSLELMRLNNTLADFMRQQQVIIDDLDAQGIDIASPEAKAILDPISLQVAEVNEKIAEETNRMGVMKEAA